MESVRRRVVSVRRRLELWLSVSLVVLLPAQFATIGREPVNAALGIVFAFLATILIVFAATMRLSPMLGAAGVIIVLVVSWPRSGGGYVGVVGWLAVGLLFYVLMGKPVKIATPAAGGSQEGHPAMTETVTAQPPTADQPAAANRPKLGDADFYYLSPPPPGRKPER